MLNYFIVSKVAFFPGYPALLVYKHLLCLPSTDLGTLGSSSPHSHACNVSASISSFSFSLPLLQENYFLLLISLLDSMGSFYFPFVNISYNFPKYFANSSSKFHLCFELPSSQNTISVSPIPNSILFQGLLKCQYYD